MKGTPPRTRLRVALADARPLARRGMAARLEEADISVSGHAATPEATLALVRTGKPADVLVLGLRRWMEVLARVRAERPGLPVLNLTGLDETAMGLWRCAWARRGW